MDDHAARACSWEGFFNTRDLGGLPVRGGGTTRFGAFVRAADLRFVTRSGWQQAYEAGIRTVMDLRNEDEIRPRPRPATGEAGSGQFAAGEVTAPIPPGIDHTEVPLDGIEDVAFWRDINQAGLNGTPLYYPAFLERQASRCAAVISTLAGAPPDGVLFHCAAGRDRTGLVALLLLAFAGAEPEAIATDYEMSRAAMPALFHALGRQDEGPKADAILARYGTTARAAVLDVLADFDAERYLHSAGVPAADLDAVRARLSP
ncbi:tyrosine-protein phosphatase [Haloechinothrix sp. LS1_15]|nr:tyrosine-protein phosphatase [Haloechinothrix sp. LS1_15]